MSESWSSGREASIDALIAMYIIGSTLENDGCELSASLLPLGRSLPKPSLPNRAEMSRRQILPEASGLLESSRGSGGMNHEE